MLTTFPKKSYNSSLYVEQNYEQQKTNTLMARPIKKTKKLCKIYLITNAPMITKHKKQPEKVIVAITKFKVESVNTVRNATMIQQILREWVKLL